jgi:hypothetical protein
MLVIWAKGRSRGADRDGIETELHRQRVRAHGKRHALDMTVAFDTADCP